jgi:plasmid stabilization system protein ParE
VKVIRFRPGADAEVEAETRYYRRQAGAEVSRRFVEAVEQATRVAFRLGRYPSFRLPIRSAVCCEVCRTAR